MIKKGTTSSKKKAVKTLPKKESVPVVSPMMLPSHARRIDDGSIIDIRTPLWEKPKNAKLRYDVSGSQDIVIIPKEEEVEWLTPKQELFCQYYCMNEETRFNATQSYALAYGYDLDGASTEVIRDELTDEIVKKSERSRLENICWAAGKMNLRKVKIQERITQLFNQLKQDTIVDREMMKLILQNEDNRAKQDMIKEYNKLMQRITDKTKDESESDVAKAEVYRTLQDKIKAMPKEEVSSIIQDLLASK